MCSTAKVAD
uniref:Uncharacterized protein n=1 Tax=Moniliophthora roreri TaxID=221103 RepID=A0A0W0GA45_MONRR